VDGRPRSEACSRLLSVTLSQEEHMPSLSPRSTNRLPVAGGASFGISMFAGLLLLLSGGFHILLGLAAAIDPSENLWGTQAYSYSGDVKTWGWLHLVLGVIAVVVGGAIMLGKAWGFIIGLVVAFLSALENFAFLPHEPFWSATMLALDIVVIWALTAELREPN
jgi:hypothetical protein